MAFVRKRAIYTLDFAGDRLLDGLTVRARGTSTGAALELQRHAAILQDDGANLVTQADALEEVVRLLAPCLVEWDMVDEDGGLVELSEAGLLSLEPAELMAIVATWQQAIQGVTDPLAAGSTSGAPSPVPPLTMEPPSASLAS